MTVISFAEPVGIPRLRRFVLQNAVNAINLQIFTNREICRQILSLNLSLGSNSGKK